MSIRRTTPLIAVASLAFVAVACAPSTESPAADLVVRGATVIDGTGAAPRADTDIFVYDGEITAVVPGGSVAVPEGATVVEADGAFVMPGLSDMHVHFSLGMPVARQAGETDEVLRRLLYYGVTSVLNLGASAGSTDSIRAQWGRQERGELPGPTIYATGGHINIPGGHPVWTIFPPPLRALADSILRATPDSLPAELDPLGIGISFVRTEGAARMAVRERAAGGMHAIKITVESGPSEFGDDHPVMPVDMIRAIVDEAGQHGLPVFAHVSSPMELDSALAGGAAGIVHSVAEPPYPGEAYVQDLADRDFRVVPTLSLYDSFIRYLEDPARLDDPFLREMVSDDEIAVFADAGMLDAGMLDGETLDGAPLADSLAKWREETDATTRWVGMLHALGVPVVLGTDVGNPMVFAGFTAHEELAHLVDAGLSPMEAIQAGSIEAARMIGRDDEFGSVTVGKRADFLILDADPLADIRNTRRIRAVIARGRVVDREALRRSN